ncbi:MAG: efflux RND transporter permease subunit [Planctomycetia bacterium]|nr:efflux RND transporter permease subunit [Planctomycetia bacterium]
MFARFFIDRPIFASVISVVIVILGTLAYFQLPMTLYPDVAPPTIFVRAEYPGADAETVAATVAVPLEEQINGVEDMLYMSTNCANNQVSISITFKVGTDLNMAQVLVQNRVSIATPKLPEVVRSLGVTTKKMSPTQILYVNLYSLKKGTVREGCKLQKSVDENGREYYHEKIYENPEDNEPYYDMLYLSNYHRLHTRDVISRLYGVGDVSINGEKEYAMRIWLDPDKMMVRHVSASDVVDAISKQNVEVSAGQLGQQPVEKRVSFQYILKTQGRLLDAEEFGRIVIRTEDNGEVVRLKDIARLEMDSKTRDVVDYIEGDLAFKDEAHRLPDGTFRREIYRNTETSTLSISQLPGANALKTAEAVREKMMELEKQFPPGLKYAIIYDTTPFIEESIAEVQHTLRDAVILVAAVVILFLQSWRAAIIPLLAVPVSLIGTFAVMSVMGFSLNNLSLFGLVLAIGIVVDDAIVVVENVERHIARGLSPKEAARAAMDEVSGALVAIALVLSCVFVPCAFLTGVTGQFFRQFALTIAISTIISAFNSLTLSPALAALLLKPHGTRRDPLTWLMEVCLGWFFKLFNVSFSAITWVYVRLVGVCLRLSFIVMILYGGLLWLTVDTFKTTPTGFVTSQDRGYLMAFLQLPDSASLDRTIDACIKFQNICFGDPRDPNSKPIPGIRAVSSVDGVSFLAAGAISNMGSITVILDSFEERKKLGITDLMIRDELMRRAQEEIPEALVNVNRPAPVDGMGKGASSGFKLQLQDRGSIGLAGLQAVTTDLIDAANANPRLNNLQTQFRAGTPQKYIDIDREKAMDMGVDVNEIFTTLQVFLGSKYVNDVTFLGRNFQVKVQADGPFRIEDENLNRLHVKNRNGDMVPLGSVCTVRDKTGPLTVPRYNMFPAAAISGEAAMGTSSGDALLEMERLCDEILPQGMGYEWSEMSLLERMAGNTAIYVFMFAVLFVFLVLAAQYESLVLPMAIILVVPMCLLCSLIGVRSQGLDMNIFTQIAFLVLVGLACKNAILIVEFAKVEQDNGLSRFDAALKACELRLRPIIMTSLAFILGVVPLLFSSGAGFEMRFMLGLAVFSGMLGVTVFGLFLTPVFYSVIMMIFGRRKKEEKEEIQDKQAIADCD